MVNQAMSFPMTLNEL